MANNPADKAGVENGSTGAGDQGNTTPEVASNGDASKKISAVGMRRCFFAYQVLVGYTVEVKVS